MSTKELKLRAAQHAASRNEAEGLTDLWETTQQAMASLVAAFVALFVWISNQPSVAIAWLTSLTLSVDAATAPSATEYKSESEVKDVLDIIDSLRSELHGQSREKLERAATLLNDKSKTHAKKKSSQKLSEGTPTATPAVDNSATGFLKRTFSFGRLPPQPPTPPIAEIPRKPFRPLKPLYKWFARTFPDMFWAMTGYRNVEWELPQWGDRLEIRTSILNSTQVQAAIKVSAEVNGITVEQATKNAERIFEVMAANMWVPVLRILAYMMRKVFKLLYPFGMDVGGSEIQRVREAARKGPLLLLPSHKSYMDFLIVSYICFQYKLPLPHVVSGDNLNFPIVGPILRWGGAFFIQRTFSTSDPLYRSVFNEYIIQLLVRGRAVECFIEGGRSRTGKLLPPKVGFLRGIMDAVIDRQIGDVYLVPISLGYDRLIENQSYIKELTGGKKRAEQLVSFIRSAFTLLSSTYTRTLNFGKINVGIGEPISLHQYLTSTMSNLPESVGGPVVSSSQAPLVSQPSTTTITTEDINGNGDAHNIRAKLQRDSDYGGSNTNSGVSTPTDSYNETGIMIKSRNRTVNGTSTANLFHSPSTSAMFAANSAATVAGLPPSSVFTSPIRKYLTTAIGYRVLYDINRVSTVLPTALVGTILFTQYGRGIRESELVKKAKWLRRQLISRGGRVQMMQEDMLQDSIMAVVNQVLEGKVKGDGTQLVKRHKDILMLSVYSPAERMELSLYRNQLIHLFVQEGILLCAFYACELQKTNYPAYVDKDELTEAVKSLSNILKLEFIFKPSPGIDFTVEEATGFLLQHGILSQDESDPSQVRYSVNDQISKDAEYQGTYTYLFVCSLFWPFIDSYYLVALSCYRLLPARMLEEETLIRWIQTLGESLYFEGLLDLYEAISSATLSNGLTLLENWNVIQYVSIESDSSTTRPSNKRIVQLTVPNRDESVIEQLVLKIGRFRKRLRAYRSRRYRSRVNNAHIDAINVVKRMDIASGGKIVK